VLLRRCPLLSVLVRPMWTRCVRRAAHCSVLPAPQYAGGYKASYVDGMAKGVQDILLHTMKHVAFVPEDTVVVCHSTPRTSASHGFKSLVPARLCRVL
jgi:hypothetical protein